MPKFLRSLSEVKSALAKLEVVNQWEYPETCLGWSGDHILQSGLGQRWGDRICDGFYGNDKIRGYILPYLCACGSVRTIEPIIVSYATDELHLVETEGHKFLEPIKIDENEMFFDRTPPSGYDEGPLKSWHVLKWTMESSVRSIFLKIGIFGKTKHFLCRCLHCGMFSLVKVRKLKSVKDRRTSKVEWYAKEISEDPIVNSKEGDFPYSYPNGKVRNRHPDWF